MKSACSGDSGKSTAREADQKDGDQKELEGGEEDDGAGG